MIFRIALKDLKLFFGDRRAMLLSFALPIALISLFVFMFGGSGPGDMAPIDLLVADEDKTSESKILCDDLDSLPSLKIELTETAEGIENVKSGDALAVLIIRKNFTALVEDGKPGFELVLDNTRPTEGEMLQGQMMMVLFRNAGRGLIKEKVLDKITSDLSPEDSVDRDEISAFIDEMMDEGFGGGVETETAETDGDEQAEMIEVTKVSINEEVSGMMIQSVAGTAVMMLLFSVAGMGASLLDEKEKGTLKRLLYTPITPLQILFGKLTTAVAISMMQLLVVFGFAQIAFGLDLFYNLPALLLTLLATSFTCGCFGIFIASISTSRKQVEGMSTLVVLVMSAIGGSMVPSMFMPEFMQKLGVLSVNYWSIQSVYDIYLRDFSLVPYITKVAILFVIGVAMLLISLPFYKRNIVKLN